MITHTIPLLYGIPKYYPLYATGSGAIIKSQLLNLPLS